MNNILKKNSSISIFFISLVLLLIPYTYLSNSYIPGSDEARQIESAIYLKNGNGYVTPLKYNEKLLQYENHKITNEFRYQTNWPPGYSYIIYLFLIIGLSPSFAGIIVKTICLGVALTGAISLKNILFKSKKNQLIYSTLIFIYIYIYYKISASDLLVLGLFCLIIKIILEDNDIKKNYVYNKIKIGIIAAIIISIKYSGLFIIIFIAILYIIKFINKEENNLKKVIFTLIFPLLTFIYIFALNYINTGLLSSNIINNNKSVSFVPIYWFFAPFDALLFKTTMIESGVAKFYLFKNNALLIFFKILMILVICYFFIKSWKSLLKEKIELIKLFLIVFISISIYLLTISILYFNGDAEWTPVADGRYYLPALPLLIAIIVIIILKDNEFELNHIRKKILYVTIFTIFLLILSENYFNRKAFIINNISNEVIKEIKLIKENSPNLKLVVFADEDFHRSSLDIIPNAIVYTEKFNREWNVDKEGEANVVLICLETIKLIHQQKKDNCKSLEFKNSALYYNFNIHKFWNNNIIYIKKYVN